MARVRFVWGYIYSILTAVRGGFLVFLTVLEAREAATTAVGFGIAAILLLFSAYGILRRRRWGLILTQILLALELLVSLLLLYLARNEVLIPGHIPLAMLGPIVQFCFALFFFVYFLRRRAFFR